jgi:enoyl-CoA hydratase/carnithine racemase
MAPPADAAEPAADSERVERVVRVEVRDAVATITLDSPANRNALSARLLTDLHLALDRAEQPDVRVIVLTHTPPTFCAGADLKERARPASDGGDNSTGSSPMVGAIRRLMDATQPTIAAVQGPVRAGGVGLMAACDLVVVHPGVSFAFTEVRIGVAPAIISVPILRRTPWSKLAAPFLTGEAFDASAALDMGLITHVADDVDTAVAALVAGVLAGAPGAVAATKRLLHHSSSALDDEFAAMQALSERLFAGEEAAEGMASFAERRPPRWTSPG